MENWMAKLRDDMYVCQISIPGTHDSASYKAGNCAQFAHWVSQSWWKCQEMTVHEQLQAGIRYFDLRLRYYPTKQNVIEIEQKFHLHHGNVYLGTPDYIMKVFKQFLIDHPSQFIIIQFQQEHSGQDHVFFGEQLQEYLNSFSLPIYNYNKKDEKLPAVGQLRGKIWLIQGWGVSMGQFHVVTGKCIPYFEGKKYMIQNLWNDSQNYFHWDQTKQRAIKHLIDFKKFEVNKLRINFISWEHGTRGCHNNYLSSLIDQYSRLGVCIMDYPPKELIKKIIDSNKVHYKKDIQNGEQTRQNDKQKTQSN